MVAERMQAAQHAWHPKVRTMNPLAGSTVRNSNVSQEPP